MKRVLLLSLIWGSAFAEVPSDIKRTQIELEKDKIDMYRANANLNLAAGSSKSDFTPERYIFKNAELKAGTKMIIGRVDDYQAVGFALAPDLNLKLRLDESGKKMRLEVGGNLIAAIDFQMIFTTNPVYNKYLYNAYKEIVIESQIRLEKKQNKFNKLKFKPNLTDKEKEELIISEKEINEEIKNLQFVKREIAQIEENIKNPKAYITMDISALNLGAKYKDVSDALYKFAGASGSMVTFSFDTAAKSKSGNIKVGVCGIFNILTVNAGKFNTKMGEHTTYTGGASGSVCGRIGIGPVLLSHTLEGGVEIERNRYFQTGHVNSTARLGVKGEIISGYITEVGAFHTYSKEWYPGGTVDSHMVGGGLTVLAK